MDTIKKKALLCIVFCAIVGTIMACKKEPVLLTQNMLDKANDVFVVKKNYTASGAVLQIPKQLKIVFAGGKIDSAELVGNHSSILVMSSKPVFGKNVHISGVWDVGEVHDRWFEFDKSKDFVSNQIISNILAFSNELVAQMNNC